MEISVTARKELSRDEPYDEAPYQGAKSSRRPDGAVIESLGQEPAPSGMFAVQVSAPPADLVTSERPQGVRFDLAQPRGYYTEQLEAQQLQPSTRGTNVPSETMGTADNDWPAEVMDATDTDWPAETTGPAHSDWPAEVMDTTDTDWPAETTGPADPDWPVQSDEAVDVIPFAFAQPAALAADPEPAPYELDEEREWNPEHPELPVGMAPSARAEPSNTYMSAQPGEPLKVPRRSSLETWAPELSTDQAPTPVAEAAAGAAVPADGWGDPLDAAVDRSPPPVLIRQGEASPSDVSDGIPRPQLRRVV